MGKDIQRWTCAKACDGRRRLAVDVDDQLVERTLDRLSVDEVSGYVSELRQLLQDSELAERKAFITSFVREIVVRGDEATLRYVLPLASRNSAGSADNETLAVSGVLASVRSGGPSSAYCTCGPTSANLCESLASSA